MTDIAKHLTKSSLKALMILNRYLPIIGGAELQANQLSQQLQSLGHEVKVITRRVRRDLPQEDVINGIPVKRLSPIGLGRVANALMLFRMLFYLLREARQADILHVHSIGPVGLATIIAGKITDTPVVLKIATMGDISRSTDKKVSLYTQIMRQFILPQWLWRTLLGQASTIIALSDEIVEEARESGLAKKTYKITNGVDIERFRPVIDTERRMLREKLGLSKDNLLVFYSGRLVHRKRVDVLIDAIANLVPAIPNIHLLLAGAGRLQQDGVEDDLRAQVERVGLQSHVTFLGNIDNVDEYLKVVDCFAFGSEREGMPNVILEAMASALPIIASRIDSITELIDEDMGYLCPIGDVEAFARGIRSVFDHPAEAQAKGQAVRQHVEEQYAIEKIAQQYEQLYYRLLNR